MSQNRIFTRDSAVISASIYAEDEISPVAAASVTWEFIDPTGTAITVSAVPSAPVVDQTILLTQALTVNAIPYSAWTVLKWDGANWNPVAPVAAVSLQNNTANISLPGSVTSLPGLYHGRAQFMLPDGTTRSTPVQFEVIDPLTDKFNIAGEDLVVERAWMKFEDLFDSDLGGPHLRDATKAMFSKDKVAMLLPDALYAVNNVYQPQTSFDVTSYPYDQHGPLLTQALLCETIHHLMRSYVEQWTPGQANIGWFDRRDYLQRWQGVLTVEEQKFLQWLDLFKKDQMAYGQVSTLVGGYGSFYGRYPRYMRGRYPYVARY